MQQLSSLEELTLLRSFTSRLDPFTRAAFKLASAPLQPLIRPRANPKLRVFKYKPNRDGDDDYDDEEADEDVDDDEDDNDDDDDDDDDYDDDDE